VEVVAVISGFLLLMLLLVVVLRFQHSSAEAVHAERSRSAVQGFDKLSPNGCFKNGYFKFHDAPSNAFS